MYTTSNNKTEIDLQRIKYQVYRVTKKEAMNHALAIGFSHSAECGQDGKYTSEQHPRFTVFPTCVALFAQKQQILQSNPFTQQASFQHKCVIQVQQYLCMVQEKIKLETHYYVESKVIDSLKNQQQKQAVFVNRSSGYVINKKQEMDLAFYYIDIFEEVQFQSLKLKTKSMDFQGWPTRTYDLVFKQRLLRSQNLLIVSNTVLNPIHFDLKAAKSVGLPRPILSSKAIFAMIIRIIVQNLLGYEQTKVQQSQMKLIGLAYPGDQFQIRVWRQQGRFYVQGVVMERKTKVVRGQIGLRHSPKI